MRWVSRDSFADGERGSRQPMRDSLSTPPPGLLIAFVMAATGTLLALGASGGLGASSPWIVPTASAPFLGLVAWVAVTSLRGWRTRELGPAFLVLGVLNAAALPVGIVGWLSPYTHTKATAGIDFAMALVSTPLSNFQA